MLPGIQDSQVTKLLGKYKNIPATKKDILDALNNYRGLGYKLEKFVFNDGLIKELFNLNGTIPVVYKSNTYHIPICIWLMDTHPNNAPICYVKPTPTMQIKVSMFVDHNGKIYLPYLHDWQPNNSDLLGLIQVMVVTFGEQPPVYSRPKDSAAPYPSQSYMPQPNLQGGGNYNLPYPAGGGTGAAFPPYPTGNNFGSFPPYPPQASGSSGYPPYVQNFPQVPGTPYSSGYNPTNTNQTGTITEEHIKASLISAVEDKLRRRIQERVNQCQAEIDTLNRTKQELTEGRTKIDSIINKLEREEVDINKNIAVLKEKEEELQRSLDSLSNDDPIDVDEAVVTTAPLYRQLLNAYAEEAAIEDAIYYLAEGFRSGVIDLELFLKHVRQLSRKQFMHRAIMQKCRQKAGLAG